MVSGSSERREVTKKRFDCGLIGVGTMGQGLAHNLVKQGHNLAVFDQKPHTLQKVVEEGAVAVGSLEELIPATNVLMTCLPSVSAIEAVYAVIIEMARPGMIVCDFSTADPQTTKEFSKKLREKGADLVDCPMLRNVQAAWEGTLQLLVGGEASSIERVMPMLKSVSEKQVLTGQVGSGHAIKLINNATTVANGAILCEVFAVARRMDVDLEVLTEVMSASFASSKKLPETSRRLIANDHTAAFSVDVSLKDIALFEKMASELGAIIPVANATKQVFQMTSAMGYGDEHNSRVASVIAQAMGTSFGDD